MALEALSGWTREQKSVVAAAYLGWMLDAFDFFLMVFVFRDIAAEFNTQIPAVAVAVVLTLAMLPYFVWARSRQGRAAHATVGRIVARTGLQWLMPLPLAFTVSCDPMPEICFARPKSRSFTCPWGPTMMFSGLMSRWAMPALCAACSAPAD